MALLKKQIPSLYRAVDVVAVVGVLPAEDVHARARALVQVALVLVPGEEGSAV